MTLWGVAERDSPEISGRHVVGVGGAEDVFKIHETARGKVRAANAEGKWRLFWLLNFLHHSSVDGCCYCTHGCIGHVRCARRCSCQLLLQRLDLLLLLRHLLLLIRNL